MALRVTVTVQHLDPSKPTIYTVLKSALGREPTNAELADECRRIIADARIEREGAR